MTADVTTSEDPVSNTGEQQLRLLEIERTAIMRAYDENRITDESRRRLERDLLMLTPEV